MAKGEGMPYKPKGKTGYVARRTDSIDANVMGLIDTWIAGARLSYLPKELEDGTSLDNVVLMFRRNDALKNTIMLTLTDLTAPELSALREFLNMAFEIVKPIVEARDKAARDAWEIDGDDTNYRGYRRPPNVVIRYRAIFEHATGCVERSTYVPRALREKLDPIGRSGDGGAQVAEDTAGD